ncbi:unnamed protein product [Penicillium salamii]|nr:unnamed protein product [Penicillium salamii]
MNGRFGEFGGRYAPESQFGFLLELSTVFDEAMVDLQFWDEYWRLLPQPPSPLHQARAMTKLAGGAKVWLKREDLNGYASHSRYHITGQILLARRMRKSEIITDCGSARHGIECAIVCSQLGMKCTVFMGARDALSQQENVNRITRLGAIFISVNIGSKKLRAAAAEAMRASTNRFQTAYYLPSCPVGPHPYPLIARTFQSIVGTQTVSQILKACGKFPKVVIAPMSGIGAGLGLFYPFLAFPSIRIVGVESVGSAALRHGSKGVLLGAFTKVLQDNDGQILESVSLCPSMDFPASEPEAAHWYEHGRLECTLASDGDVSNGLRMMKEIEGIECGLDTAHAVKSTIKMAEGLDCDDLVILLVTGSDDIAPEND